MTSSRDPDRLIRAFLAEGQTDLSDQVYDAVRSEIDRTSQRVFIGPWRTPFMGNTLRIGLAAAVAVVIAIVGLSLLPRGPSVGDDASPSAPTATPSPSPVPSPTPPGWPTGALEVGRHDVGFQGVPFSFRIPSEGWESSEYEGVIEKGTFPSTDFRSIAFLQTYDSVAIDPCAATTKEAGPSVSDMADALTTIPGTEADAPTDVTIDGRPAKLVVFTISDDFGCDRSSFWLFGRNSAFPNTRDSTFRIWVFELDGTRYLIISDQARPNAEIGPEVAELVESIQFE